MYVRELFTLKHGRAMRAKRLEAYRRLTERAIEIIERPGAMFSLIEGGEWNGPWRVSELRQDPVSDVCGLMGGHFGGSGSGIFGGSVSGSYSGSFQGKSSPNFSNMTNPLIYLCSEDSKRTERLLLPGNHEVMLFSSAMILNPFLRCSFEGLRLDSNTRPLVERVKASIGNKLVFTARRNAACDYLRLMVRKERDMEPVFFRGYQIADGAWHAHAIRIGEAEYVFFPELFLHQLAGALQEEFPEST